MNRIFAITVCAFALPCAAHAATRTYEIGAFESVAVAEGVAADITIGSSRSVVAEAKSNDFGDLRITVEGNVLHIDRPASSWFSNWFSHRPAYQVHVVTPALRSLGASSGAQVAVRGNLEGDLSVFASSGGDVDVSQVAGGRVSLSTSSGGQISVAGSCVSLHAKASSGSDLDADDLKCETVSLNAASGSDVSVAASKSVTGNASSGSDIRIRGKSAVVEVDTTSGGRLVVRD